MKKLNEQIKAALTFERREFNEGGFNHTIISTSHKGIYRQYSYVNYPTDLMGNPQDAAQLEEEAKNILTWAIEKELNKRNNDSERKID